MNGPSMAGATPSFIARHRIVLWRIVFFALAGLFVAGSPAWTEHWLSAVLRVSGIVLVCAAAMGRMWCALYISGRKAIDLVTQGPYSVCRHPLYLFNLLGFIGVGLLSESLSAVAIVAVAFSVLYPSVLTSEERMLEKRFPAYTDYRRRTPALLPRWRNYCSPAEWTVSVGAYLRNIGDSLWFPLMAVAVELTDLAHETGLVSGRFVLY